MTSSQLSSPARVKTVGGLRLHIESLENVRRILLQQDERWSQLKSGPGQPFAGTIVLHKDFVFKHTFYNTIARLTQLRNQLHRRLEKRRSRKKHIRKEYGSLQAYRLTALVRRAMLRLEKRSYSQYPDLGSRKITVSSDAPFPYGARSTGKGVSLSDDSDGEIELPDEPSLEWGSNLAGAISLSGFGVFKVPCTPEDTFHVDWTKIPGYRKQLNARLKRLIRGTAIFGDEGDLDRLVAPSRKGLRGAELHEANYIRSMKEGRYVFK
jgi:hypothetical protein